MKLKVLLLLSIVLIMIGCAATDFRYAWPYIQMPPEKVKKVAPKNYSDCIAAIDTVLTPLVKQHFKNQDSTIAVIEICNEIGGFFITNWWMARYNKQTVKVPGYNGKVPKVPIDLPSHFIKDGIYHPEAMLRIMFTCYYKYLNSQAYNWDEEISKEKNIWPSGNPTNYSELLPDTIAKLERKILSKYEYSLLSIADTVNILYNRPPRFSKKSSDWYYLTGIINFKIPETESINIKIIDIKSEFNQNYMIDNTDTLKIGDTLTDFHEGWLSRNVFYFKYSRCKEYREAFNVK